MLGSLKRQHSELLLLWAEDLNYKELAAAIQVNVFHEHVQVLSSQPRMKIAHVWQMGRALGAVHTLGGLRGRLQAESLRQSLLGRLGEG